MVHAFPSTVDPATIHLTTMGNRVHRSVVRHASSLASRGVQTGVLGRERVLPSLVKRPHIRSRPQLGFGWYHARLPELALHLRIPKSIAAHLKTHSRPQAVFVEWYIAERVNTSARISYIDPGPCKQNEVISCGDEVTESCAS